MSLAPLNVPDLLRRYHLRPDKRLGQNFLVDQNALEKVVAVAEIKPDDIVLEVGPGLGGLTRLLALKARRVVAVELDSGLIPPLQEVISPFSNIQLIQGDILALDLERIIGESGDQEHPSYLVVANIPYYITSALIRYLLEMKHPPKCMALTIQREVAGRICAAPGEMSLLALSVQVYGHAQTVAHIPASSFYPIPKVDSAVVRVDRYDQPLISGILLPLFFRLAKAGFSQRRKTLRNSLAAGMHWEPKRAEAILTTAGIDSRRRAETLSIAEWGKLTRVAQESP